MEAYKMTAEELEKEVKEIIAQVIEIPLDEIDSDADFVHTFSNIQTLKETHNTESETQ